MDKKETASTAGNSGRPGIFFVYFMPLLAWIVFIYILSSISGTGTFEFTWGKFVTRKLAHVAEFFILGILLARTIGRSAVTRRQLQILVILFGLVIGLADEVHQLFVFGREGQAGDALIDGVGVVLGLVAYNAFLTRRAKKRAN